MRLKENDDTEAERVEWVAMHIERFLTEGAKHWVHRRNLADLEDGLVKDEVVRITYSAVGFCSGSELPAAGGPTLPLTLTLVLTLALIVTPTLTLSQTATPITAAD